MFLDRLFDVAAVVLYDAFNTGISSIFSWGKIFQ